MLTSSRARWRSILTGITRKNAPNFVLTRGTCVAFPRFHPTIIHDMAEERAHPISAGKNSFRSYGTSPQSLQRLVEESKYDEAAAMLLELRSRHIHVQPHPVYFTAIYHLLSQEVLSQEDHELLELWLRLLPDARSPQAGTFENLSDDLRRHIVVEPALARLVGGAFAQKGYRALVEDEILPVARALFGGDGLTSLEQELSQTLASSLARIASKEWTAQEYPEVFEDASDDYASIMATSIPPPPSVMEIVEATLPQTLPASDSTGDSVFEDETDGDYLTHRSDTLHPPRQFPSDQLVRLVESKRYEDALHLLMELQHLHVRIPFSHTFGTAALAALRRPPSEDYTSEERLRIFTTWFSFIPPAHEPQGTNDVPVIQRTIMRALLIDIPLIMRFCTILAGKGYANLVGRQELAVVMRFASSQDIQQHVRDLESAYSDYWNAYQPEQAASECIHFSGRVRSDAVRYLAYSGKVEDALALVPKRGEPVRLSVHTYDKLLRTLRDTVGSVNAKSIRHIESLREEVAGRGPQAQIRQMFAEEEDAVMAAELRTAATSVHAGTLPETLRYLKHALKRAEDNPHPFIIAEFLERYLATGRTRAPTLLLELATRTSYHSTSILLFAEMLYYRRLGQHHLIVQTFVDHFYISGVPRTKVLGIYNSIQDQSTHAPGSTSASFHPRFGYYSSPLTRISNFDPSKHLPRGKAWPMKIHCNLVWHALVALTPTNSELEKLYSKLLNLAHGIDPAHPSWHLASITPLLPPPSWGRRVDHAAFTPFMRRLMASTGPGRGSQIIGDMISLDIQPSVYHFTELAGYYARTGQVEPAMALLDGLESSSGLLERLTRQILENEHKPTGLASSLPHTDFNSQVSGDGLEAEPQPNQINQIPEPDLAFYTSLMRGFLIAQSIPGFQRVHKRLLELRKLLPRKRFMKNQEAVLSEVYNDFRILSRKQGYDWRRQKLGFKAWLENHRQKKQEENS